MPKGEYRKRLLAGKRLGDCAMCGTTLPVQLLDVDHVIPQAEGGSHNIENLWPLCLNHHRLKSMWEASRDKQHCWSCNNNNDCDSNQPICQSCKQVPDWHLNVKQNVAKQVQHYYLQVTERPCSRLSITTHQVQTLCKERQSSLYSFFQSSNQSSTTIIHSTSTNVPSILYSTSTNASS